MITTVFFGISIIVLSIVSCYQIGQLERDVEQLKRDATGLECRLERREIKENCASGNHEWEMNHFGTKPVISCKRCYVIYKESKK